MTLPVADWVIPLFFLAALVLMVRFRRQLQAEDRESYKYMGAGLVLLALVSVSRVYFADGYFAGIPFLSDALFYRITSWIVIVTGTTLMVSGLATWLPVARRLRGDMDQKLKRMELLKKIEQLNTTECQPEALFQTALAHMVEQFEFDYGVAYRYSRAHGRAYLTGAYPSIEPAKGISESIVLSPKSILQLFECPSQESGPLVCEVFGIADAPQLVLPVNVDSRVAGFFLFWQAGGMPNLSEGMSTLKTAANVLARRISAEQTRMKASYYVQVAQLQNGLGRIQTSGQNKSDVLSAMLRQILIAVNADVASLRVVNKSERFYTRYSIGAAGSLLLEKELPLPKSYFELTQGQCSDGPTLLKAGSREGYVVDALLGTEFKSGVIAPIWDNLQSSVTLVVGARKVTSLTSIETGIISSQTHAIRLIVRSVLDGDSRVSVDRCLLRLNSLWTSFHRTGDLTVLFDETCEWLAKHLPVDVVRISTIDPAGQFLTSQALGGSTESDTMTPTHGHMIRSLMPWHEKCIRTRKIVSARAGKLDGQIEPAEANQLFSDRVHYVALVPILANGKVCGIISLGSFEGRASSGLRKQELLLARTGAQGLGFAVALAGKSIGAFRRETAIEQSPTDLRSDFILRSRVKSSLSGILGSVELLQAQHESVDPHMNRYLAIIDRSARRINEYIDPQEITSTID